MSGNGLTMVQKFYSVDTVNTDRYFGRGGGTVETGGLAVDDDGVKVTCAWIDFCGKNGFRRC